MVFPFYKKLKHTLRDSDFNPRVHALNQMPPHKNVSFFICKGRVFYIYDPLHELTLVPKTHKKLPYVSF